MNFISKSNSISEGLKPPNIFEYLNFRYFLKDYYQYLKKSKPIISYKYLTNRYQLGSHSHYHDICQGRNLTKAFFDRYLILLGYPQDSSEAKYFLALVAYNQAKKDDIKAQHFHSLAKFAPQYQTQILKEKSTEFYADFYNLMVFNLIEIFKNNNNPFQSIHLPKSLNINSLHNAFQNLQTMKMIEWDSSQNQWKVKYKHLSIKEDHKKFILQNTHRFAMELGIDFYKTSYKDQIFSTLSLGVSQNLAKKIDQAILDLRSKIVEWTKEDQEEANQVLQINFQKMVLYEK